MRVISKMKAGCKPGCFLVCLMTLVVLVVSSCVINSLPALPTGRRHYCGDSLTTTLSQVCNGVYNTVTSLVPASSSAKKGKRFRSRRRALMFLPWSSRRSPRGVHDECCRKTCTLVELSSYCGDL